MQASCAAPSTSGELSDVEAIDTGPSLITRLGRWFDNLVGLLTLLAGLAAISAVPVLNLLSLGYLLCASVAVSHSGRLRDGFPGLTLLAKIGKALLCIWICLLPLRLIYDLWWDAHLIELYSAKATQLRSLFVVLAVLSGLHIAWALLRGGNFRHFLWPAPVKLVRWLWDSSSSVLRLPSFKRLRTAQWLHLFRTGLFGFLGGALWLLPGVSVFFAASQIQYPGLSVLCSLFGAFLLGTAVLMLLFLQTYAADTGKFSDHFAVAEIRRHFQRAPLAYCLALVISLIFAVPLYLLKVELTPQEVAWLPNLLFVLSIYPARLSVGWAYGRSLKHTEKRFWLSRWMALLVSLPFIGAYTLIVWLAQYFSWHGHFSLFEQHAFLIPAPLLGL